MAADFGTFCDEPLLKNSSRKHSKSFEEIIINNTCEFNGSSLQASLKNQQMPQVSKET